MKVPKNLKKEKSNSAPQYHLSCIGYTFYKTKLLESAYFLIHAKAPPPPNSTHWTMGVSM